MSAVCGQEEVGTVSILNVTSGDTKISFDPKDEAERERAKKIVTDMIKQGYAIMVEIGRDDKGPIYRRAKKFDPETCEYVIAGDPPKEGVVGKVKRAIKGAKVKAENTRAVAVAKSAGG